MTISLCELAAVTVAVCLIGELASKEELNIDKKHSWLNDQGLTNRCCSLDCLDNFSVT